MTLTHANIEAAVRRHIEAVWPGQSIEPFVWALGSGLPNLRTFRISSSRPVDPVVYVSCGAWQAETREGTRYEFFLLSPRESPSHVETLAMLAKFHASGEFAVEPGKIIDIGRPWMDGATCDHLLVSLPYPLGPALESVSVPDSSLTIRLLWLVPITCGEAAFARDQGVEALESRFEAKGLNYLDPGRVSVLDGGKA